MIITKPWADEQNNDTSFLADIWQVQMVATLAIAILFMFLGNSIPIDGGKKEPPQVKTSIKTKEPIKKTKKLPDKINVAATEVKKAGKPIQKDKEKKEPLALVFENNEALYHLMKHGNVKLFILIPEIKLQYQAIYKKRSEFDFKPKLTLNGFIYELTGASVPNILSDAFRKYSPVLMKKKHIYLIQVEKNLDKEFKKALSAGKGRFVITKDGTTNYTN